jgi:predicted enzyme related to lactoylglutathione lyase
MKIGVASVLVDDQEKALKFYTEKLGFVKKSDVSNEGYRWLTVGSPEKECDTELVLEPMGIDEARTFQKALYEKGMPWTVFGVDDLDKEYERLRTLGVVFKTAPTKYPFGSIALLDDTCGNLIQLLQR